MKQIIIYISLTILAIVAVILIFLNREPISDKAITVSQYYSVMDKFQGMDIPLYLTNDDHLLTYVDAYQRLYLESEDETKKLEVYLDNITTNGDEYYLSEYYTRFMLEIRLPAIDNDFVIENCYLNITLQNGLNFIFDIGCFSYMNIDETVDHMFLTSLEAVKDTNVSITRMKDIKITYDSLDVSINHISVGLLQDVTYTIDAQEQAIVITISHDDLLLYQCPIALYYENNQVQIVDNFLFINAYNVLKTSGPLNNIYDLSNL